MSQLKVVRAIRQGSYYGHRRRVGAEFVVDANAKESWFVDVGPAPEGAELSPDVTLKPAAAQKTFTEVMKQLGAANPPPPSGVADLV